MNHFGSITFFGALLIIHGEAFSLLPWPNRHGTPSTRLPQPVTSHTATLPLSRLAAASSNYEFALLFDCDGVILETEELHRLAYNAAFTEFDLTIAGRPVEWDVPYYDMLQNTVGGGKPKMRFHFRNTTGVFPMQGKLPPPATMEEQEALIDKLQAFKTQTYKNLLETEATPRPGLLELMDEALQDDRIAVGVCSASTKEAARKTLDLTLGPDRVSQLNVCLLGDDVSAKKPDPMIYNEARKRLGNIHPDLLLCSCVVIEDSLIGLQAAKSADMKCIITYTSSTTHQDFYGAGADAAVPDLASRRVTLESIFGPLREAGPDATLLETVRDPMPVAVDNSS